MILLSKKLWIGTVHGLYSYNLITEKTRKYKDNGVPKDNQVSFISKGRDRTIWVGTRNGFGKLVPGSDTLQMIVIPKGNKLNLADHLSQIDDIHIDPVRADRIWIATKTAFLSYDISSNTFQFAGKEIGNIESAYILQIREDPITNYLYFGTGELANQTKSYDYLVYDPKTQKPVQAINIDGSSKSRQISFYQDSLILFSKHDGLAIFNKNQNRVIQTYYNKANTEIFYQADLVDSKGNIWTGTHQGIRMYNGDNVTGKSYYYDAAFPNWYHIPSAVALDTNHQKIYMGVYGGEGLYSFSLINEEWELLPSLSEDGKIKKTLHRSLSFDESGKLVIIDQTGFFTLEPTGQIEKTDFNMEGFRQWGAPFLDSHNIFWNTNSQRFIKIDLNAEGVDDISDQVFYCNSRFDDFAPLEDSHQNVWIGGMCEGFVMYERSSDTFIPFQLPIQYKQSLVEYFVERDGQIWAQTMEGVIFKMDINRPEKGIIEIIDLPELIKKKKIKLINSESFDPASCESGAFDRLGWLWFITQQGLYRYDEKMGEIERFGKDVGIIVDDPDMNVYCAAFLTLLPDGRMFFTTRKGICIFNPEKIVNQPEIPIPYISTISVNNEPVKPDSSSFFKMHYSFSPAENFIGIDFSSLAFSSPFKVEYRYKLEGVDEDWKDPGSRRFVGYTQLNGGNYTFLLEASGPDGAFGNNAVKIGLSIAKFWYHTSWARGLFFALFIFVILLIYFNRLNRALEKEHLKIQYERDLAEIKMQALTAQMNPHFIFNSLNSIDFYIIKNDTRKASQYLNRFSRLMRLILKNSRSNYVTLRDDMEALELYLEIEALRFNHKFEYQINVAPNIDLDYIKIPPMLIQPYVENSIWHGLLHKKENGKIRIDFEFDEGKEVMTCLVTDNGIGRKKSMEMKTAERKSREHKSFGMNITKDKIEALNFLHGIHTELNIIDLYDEYDNGIGTKVELNIPI